MSKATKPNLVKKKDVSQIIANAVFTYIDSTKGLEYPTRQDIADMTGLSVKTVERHYKDIEFKPMDVPQRALTPLVLNNLFAQTRRSTQAVKLWLQVIAGWREDSPLEMQDNNLKITHNIVMNNNQDNKTLDFSINDSTT